MMTPMIPSSSYDDEEPYDILASKYKADADRSPL
jgi:hypothetical protein